MVYIKITIHNLFTTKHIKSNLLKAAIALRINIIRNSGITF